MIKMSKQSAYFRVPDLGGDRGGQKLKKDIDSIPGVISVSVTAQSNKVAVDYDSTGTNSKQIKEKIEDSGFEAQLIADVDHTM